MRSSAIAALFVLAAWGSGAVAVQLHPQPQPRQELTTANLTQCGVECLLQTVTAVGCSLTDTTCQCASKTLPQLTSACMLANCTMHDSLVVAKVTASRCNYPHEDRSGAVIVVVATVMGTMIFLTMLRLVSKAWISASLGLDDWIISTTVLLSVPSIYFTIKMSQAGFGKHVWDLEDGDLSRIIKDFYIGDIFYVADISLTKISIVVFYLRIFPQPWFRKAAYAVISFIMLSTATLTLLTIFQCKPAPFFWNKDIRGGTCVNINALGYAVGAMSIVGDLLVVSLPIPVLRHLNMGLKKKISVGLMFAVGSFGCVVSMIRLKSLTRFGNSIDPSWDYAYPVIWTIIELAAVVICASLPALRNLVMRLYPQAFVSTITSSSGHATGSKPWHLSSPSRRQNLEGGSGEFLELQQSRSTEDADERLDKGSKKSPSTTVYDMA